MSLEQFIRQLNLVDARDLRVWKDNSPGRLRVEHRGRVFTGLIPRRPFPISRPQFIILADRDETGGFREVYMIRDYDELDPDSRRNLEEILGKRYFMPSILAVEQLETSGDEFQWKVSTDKGPRLFNTRGRRNIIAMGRKIVVIDTSDNVYLIQDYGRLDSRSRRLLYKFV